MKILEQVKVRLFFFSLLSVHIALQIVLTIEPFQ